MNGHGRSRCLAALALTLGLPAMGAVAGCVSVDGGAVEVAWAIFSRDGRAINDCGCAEPAIASMRLNLISDPDGAVQPCEGAAACQFRCNRKVGATPFMIPPGQYLMSLVPVDVNGVDIAETVVRAPPAQSRGVVRGRPTALEAFMIEAGCRCNASPNQPCTGT